MSKINRKRRARKIELRHRRRAKVTRLLRKCEATKDSAERKILIDKARRINENLVPPENPKV